MHTLKPTVSLLRSFDFFLVLATHSSTTTLHLFNPVCQNLVRISEYFEKSKFKFSTGSSP